MSEVSRRSFLATGIAASTAAAAASKRSSRRASITLACADYLRFTPLATGDVRPESFDLKWVRGPRSEMLRRATIDPAMDGGEASMLQHLLRVDGGDRSLVAVPVFLLRNFPARDIYIRKDASLSASDLSGRRVGIYNS